MSRRPPVHAALTWCVALILLGLFGCSPDRSDTPADPVSRRDAPTKAAPKRDPSTAAPTDWCAGHQVPESKCTKCHPELVPDFQAAGDWCAEHGFPESVCPSCNPATPPPNTGVVDWCVEHGLPESKCTKCNPELVAEFQAAGDWCAEHDFPESVCPSCNPATPPPNAEVAALEARIVRLRAPELEAAAGIQTAPARRVAVASSVECAAHIEFDTDRLADVRALVPGVVRGIHAQVGDPVELGDPLFDLDSADIGTIQAALHSARERVRASEANVARQTELREADIASARQLELAQQELASAKAEARAARAALKMAGAGSSGPVGRYTISAPIAGTILRRPALLGTHARGDISLATIGDTSLVWALCEVPEAFADDLALDQILSVSSNANPDLSFEAPITWIAPEVDPQTRTVTVRADVNNQSGALRANQFMRGQITTSPSRAVVAVPRAAVQRVRNRELVFVRTEVGVYEPRVVRRHGGGDTVEIEGRVAAGDAVVTTGAVLLRTEIMPGSIGAGCCEVDAPGGE